LTVRALTGPGQGLGCSPVALRGWRGRAVRWPPPLPRWAVVGQLRMRPGWL